MACFSQGLQSFSSFRICCSVLLNNAKLSGWKGSKRTKPVWKYPVLYKDLSFVYDHYVIKAALGAKREVRQRIVREVQILVFLKRAIYSNERVWLKGRNGVGCNEEEINQVMSAVTLSSRGQFLEAATMRGWPMQAQSHSCLHQSASVAAADSVAALVLWSIYECSDTTEQMITPGGSNNERLADVGTHKCYICKVAQYLTSRETFVCAFM